MATYYVRSTDGNNSDDGSTWALAKADLHTPTWAAGDVIYVSQNHAQSTAAAITIATAGTATSPTQIIGVNDSAAPPTAVTTTGKVTTTGTSNLNVSGVAYVEGLVFEIGTSTAALFSPMSAAGHQSQTYKNCTIRLVTTSVGGRTHLGSALTTVSGQIKYENCWFRFGATAQGFVISANATIVGGGIESGGTSPTALIAGALRLQNDQTVFSGFDMTHLGSTASLIKGDIASSFTVVFRNCKLPSSWTGSLFSTAITLMGLRGELYNCDAGDTNYRIWIEDYAGALIQDTGIYRTDGYTDGTTPLSWKITSTANAEYPLVVFETPEMMVWNETVGSSITATVEFIVNSSGTALKDNEIWLEIQYQGTSGNPLSLFVNDSKATVLATAADQTTSSVSWTGATTPTKQKCSVSFTPQEKGFVIGKIMMAKASTTIYVCPKLDIS